MRVRATAELGGTKPRPRARLGMRQVGIEALALNNNNGNRFRGANRIDDDGHTRFLVNDADQRAAGQCRECPGNEAFVAEIDNVVSSFRADRTQTTNHDADRCKVGEAA